MLRPFGERAFVDAEIAGHMREFETALMQEVFEA